MANTSAIDRINARAKKSLDRQSSLEKLVSEYLPGPELLSQLTTEISTDTTKEPEISPKNKGIGRHLVTNANNKLINAEQLGLFTSYPISERNSIPTLLARIPIFLPQSAAEQKLMLDNDLAFCFETPFGRGRRFGPPVTMYDEEVLFSLISLSVKRLVGKAEQLPIPITDDNWLRDKDGNLTVQLSIQTISQIIEEMGLSSGGNNYKACMASLKRLNHVSIELETKKKDLYLGETWTGEKIRLIDIKWQAYKTDGVIFAQFTPIIAKWMSEQFTYYRMDIRRKLKTDNARAWHRFLSTQGNSYEAKLEYIADAVGWSGNRGRMKPAVEKFMTQLRDEHKWCDFEITGTGRKTPYALKMARLQTKK